MSSLDAISCTIGKNNKLYYFYKGKRISEAIKNTLNVPVGPCMTVSQRKRRVGIIVSDCESRLNVLTKELNDHKRLAERINRKSSDTSVADNYDMDNLKVQNLTMEKQLLNEKAVNAKLNDELSIIKKQLTSANLGSKELIATDNNSESLQEQLSIANRKFVDCSLKLRDINASLSRDYNICSENLINCSERLNSCSSINALNVNTIKVLEMNLSELQNKYDQSQLHLEDCRNYISKNNITRRPIGPDISTTIPNTLQIEQLQKQIAQKDAIILSMKNDNQAHASSLLKQLNTSNDKMVELNSQIHLLSDNLKLAKDSIHVYETKLNDEVKNHLTHINEAENKINKLISESSADKELISSLQNEVRLRINRINECDNEKNAIKQLLDECQQNAAASNAKCEANISIIRNNMDDMKANVVSLGKKNDSLVKGLELCKSNLSSCEDKENSSINYSKGLEDNIRQLNATIHNLKELNDEHARSSQLSKESELKLSNKSAELSRKLQELELREVEISEMKDNFLKIQNEQSKQLTNCQDSLYNQDSILKDSEKYRLERDEYTDKYNNCISVGRTLNKQYKSVQDRYDKTSAAEAKCMKVGHALKLQYDTLKASLKDLSEKCRDYLSNTEEFQRVIASEKVLGGELAYYKNRMDEMKQEKEDIENEMSDMSSLINRLSKDAETSSKQGEEMNDMKNNIAFMKVALDKLKKDKEVLENKLLIKNTGNDWLV